MSDRFEERLRRTLVQHRAAISRETNMHGRAQDCLDAICDMLTDLNAAVVKLIDIEMKRKARKR